MKSPKHGRVFISSRMDETVASRRAAFDAIQDSGDIPQVFELLPSITEHASPTTIRNADLRPETLITRGDHRSAEDKKRMDWLVDSSEYFVGIYAETFGAQIPHLHAMTPMSYEFLRFMVRWHSITSEKPQLFKSAFPDRSATIRQKQRAQKVRENCAAEIRDDLLQLRLTLDSKTNAKRWLNARDTQRLKNKLKAHPYALVFSQRVMLYLRRRTGDGFISTELMRALRSKPYFEFSSGVDPKTERSGTLETHLPAYTVLHKHLLEWLRSRPQLPEPLRLKRLKFSVTFPAFDGCNILVVAESAYHLGLSIDKVWNGSVAGKDKADTHTVTIDACLLRNTQGDRTVSATRASEKRFSEIVQAVAQARLLNRDSQDITVRFEKLDQGKRGGRRSVDALMQDTMWQDDELKQRARGEDPRQRRVFAIRIAVSDFPGMLFKACERIASSEGEVLDVHFEHDSDRSDSSRAWNPKARPNRWLQIEYATAFALIEIVARWPNEQTANAVWHSLSAELRYGLGVHSVLRGKPTIAVQGVDKELQRPNVEPKTGSADEC